MMGTRFPLVSRNGLRLWLHDGSYLRGLPGDIRSDHGPALIAKAVRNRIAAVGSEITHRRRRSSLDNETRGLRAVRLACHRRMTDDARASKSGRRMGAGYRRARLRKTLRVGFTNNNRNIRMVSHSNN
jgi:hypothetical protein